VNLHRLLPTIAAAIGLAAWPHAFAGGLAARQGLLMQVDAARAPLAVSADGAWRLHVDTHDVLHRTGLADPSRESTLQLPHGVRVLSASGDGLKVALTTDRQCIGLVDFTGAAASVSWRPWVVSDDGVAIGPEPAAWTAQMPASCGDRGFVVPVAISSDGRLVATADAVVDAVTHRVVASLPTGRRRVLRLQFVDHDARLLIASASIDERGAAPPDADALSVSVWDLASKALVNDIEIDGTPLATTAALQLGFSAQTGALWRVDERRGELVQLEPGVCGAAPRPRAPVGDDLGASFAVDPYGRWFASARPLDAARDAAELATGARSVLVVRDMATGRELQRVTSRYVLAGIVSTPDGATLFALATQPVEPETGDPIAGPPAVPDRDQVLELDLPDAATTAPRDPARAWERGFCKEPGETPGARAMARSERPLRPLWSRDLSADIPALPEDLARCSTATPAASLFASPDGGLWLDLVTHVARVDPLTGKTAEGLPTPRTRGVCSVVTPAGNGFLNAGGDTLTWRPLAAAADPARRRVVDRHPGWSAGFGARHGDLVRVLWVAGPRAAVQRDADGAAQDLLVVDVDSNGRRVRQFTRSEAADGDGQGTFDLDASDPLSQPPAPCHDARGTPIAIGYDWRAGPFGSQRGVTCGPLAGMARLVWWSGATIAPRADSSAPTPPAPAAIDGPIAVVADEQQLHVVNLALQREIAQIDLGAATDARTWVLAARRLVMVEATGADGHRWLRAYALP